MTPFLPLIERSGIGSAASQEVVSKPNAALVPVNAASPAAKDQGTTNQTENPTLPSCAQGIDLQKCAEEAKKLADSAVVQRDGSQATLDQNKDGKSAGSVVVDTAISQQSNSSLGVPNSFNSAPVPLANQRLLTLQRLLVFANANNWVAVDAAIANLKNTADASTHGDRQASRKFNGEGLGYLKAGDLANAVDSFMRGVKVDPTDVEARNNLGYALLKAQKNVEAQSVLAELLTRVPDRASAWTNYSEAFVSDPSTSIAALKLSVRLSSNRANSLSFLRSNANSQTNGSYGRIAQAVLVDFDSIPVGPLK